MLNVFVIDDHRVFIEGILMMLKKEKWVAHVQGFTEVEDFLNTIDTARGPENLIVLLDVNLNRVLNGIDICKEIKKKIPGAKIIALTLHHEKRFVKGMMNAGCDGYVLKSNSFDEIRKAILMVKDGGKYFTSEVMDLLEKENLVIDTILNLNPREKRVLESVISGMTNNDIATTLNVSKKTVEYYRKGLYIKFGVSNAVELTNEVNKHGLLS